MAHSAQIVIARVRPDADQEALELATSIWPAAERSVYRQSVLNMLETGQQRCAILVGAYAGPRLLAAQIGLVMPGRVAVVWQPCFVSLAGDNQLAVARSLFDRVALEVRAAGAQLAQGLSLPNDDDSRRLFELGGFLRVAELFYLSAAPAQSRQRVELPFQLVPADNDERLQTLIERTYVGTLDCPGLDGLRETADVIAGYRAVGDYRPQFWLIARAEQGDIGCLLMNAHPDVRHCEIVYLGLTPEARGKGWGCLLAAKALELAQDTKCEQVVLAVDATNRPAVELYLNAGFSVFDRRVVWVRTLD